MKVCVYAIAKTEEQFVDRFMDSVSQADYVVVLDTGSTDATVDKLKKRGAIVGQAEVKPWRFDLARNLSIDLCPKDSDILFCLDLDEVIAEPNWSIIIKSRWLEASNRGRYKYVWNHLPDGREGRAFRYEKIHTFEHEWYLPCHELLKRRIPGEDYWVELPITVHHYPDPAKSRGDYLALLKMAVDEFPDHDRTSHYYGRELFFRSRWQDAINELQRHLSLHTARWEDERCASMTMIAKAYAYLGNNYEAERWFFRACAEAPHLRDPWIDAANWSNLQSSFALGYSLAKRGLKSSAHTDSYVATPYGKNEGGYDQSSIGAYYLGHKVESLLAAKQAAALASWDSRLTTNFEIIQKAVALPKPIQAPAHFEKATPETTAVVTIAAYPATEVAKHIERLRFSADRVSIKLDVAMIGERYGSHTEAKIEKLLKHVACMPTHIRHVAYVDGNDTLLLGTIDELVDKFNRLQSPIVMGAERECHPIYEWAQYFPQLPHGRNFICAGCFMAERDTLIRSLELLWEIRNQHFHPADLVDNDQPLWQLAYLCGLVPVTLDAQFSLFANLCVDGDLRTEGNQRFSFEGSRVRDLNSDQRPVVLHFSGAKRYYIPWFQKLFGPTASAIAA